MKKRSTSKPPEPTFFTDRDLGPTPECEVVQILRNAGMTVEPHDAHFDQTTTDPEWLRAVAARGWVAISRNTAIMRSELEVRTIVESGARLFLCVGSYTHREYAENIVRARHKLVLWAEKHVDGFIARLRMSPPAQGERRKRRPGEIKAFDHEHFLSRFA